MSDKPEFCPGCMNDAQACQCVTYTYCPGCDSRVLTGQDVVGVPEVDGSETGADMLWHRTCYARWCMEQREKLESKP